VFRAQLHADNITITPPSNASEGETLLIVAAADGSADIDMVMDPTAGWVNRYNEHVSGSSLAIFDKVLTNSEPGVYVVRKGGTSEEWCVFALVLPAGSTYDSMSNTSGISTTATAPSMTPTNAEVITFFIVASDDPDTTEDANSFTNSTMVGNKWSSNTGGMVMLAMGYDSQTVAQPTGDRSLTLDVDGRWTGVTLAYTQQVSGFSGAYGGDTLYSEIGDGTGRVIYTHAASVSEEKNWMRVYAQWPNNDVAISEVRATLTVGGATYSDVFLDQTTNGGQMNQIYDIQTLLPAGDIVLSIYDSVNGPVFADAVRFDYSLGEQGFIEVTMSVAGDASLKALRAVTTQAHGYILEPGGTLFSDTRTCVANAIISRPQESWSTTTSTESTWTTETSRQ
jgi:hypothetical protein